MIAVEEQKPLEVSHLVVYRWIVGGSRSARGVSLARQPRPVFTFGSALYEPSLPPARPRTGPGWRVAAVRSPRGPATSLQAPRPGPSVWGDVCMFSISLIQSTYN